MDVYGADTVHETEALAHVFKGLGSGPGEKNGVVVEFQGDFFNIGIPDASLYLARGVTAGDEDIVAYLHVSLAHEG